MECRPRRTECAADKSVAQELAHILWACNSRLRGDLHAICSNSHRARRVLLPGLGVHRRNDPPRWPACRPTRSRFRRRHRAIANACAATRSCVALTVLEFRRTGSQDLQDRQDNRCLSRCAAKHDIHNPVNPADPVIPSIDCNDSNRSIDQLIERLVKQLEHLRRLFARATFASRC